jgi:hypothetical protein
MSNDRIKQEILQLVAEHDGKWYWYQIDRALSNKYTGPFENEIDELLKSGSIESRVNPEIDGMLRYWITQKKSDSTR